jgi:hypothetical protein
MTAWFMLLVTMHAFEPQAAQAIGTESLAECRLMAAQQNRIPNSMAICITADALRTLGRRAGG